jgi:hypothetical protein
MYNPEFILLGTSTLLANDMMKLASTQTQVKVQMACREEFTASHP